MNKRLSGRKLRGFRLVTDSKSGGKKHGVPKSS